MHYVLSVLHASYLYVCFVNISAYIPTEIPFRLLNLFYTNSFTFIFVYVNVDVEYAIRSNLVICNNFINYKGLEPSQWMEPPRMNPSNYRTILLKLLISKIFEKIVHDQMIDYLAQYNILYKYQSDFRTNIRLTCFFHTWMTKFWKALIMVSLLVWYW